MMMWVECVLEVIIIDEIQKSYDDDYPGAIMIILWFTWSQLIQFNYVNIRAF
jgi:hypothetical protein